MKAIISAVGHYAPEEKLTNEDLEALVDTNDEWITTRTGIKERRILGDGKGTSYMATRAAKTALDMRGLSPDEIDLLVVATVTPDMMFPNTAALVQDKLGASNCWGFDLNAGCAGFVFGLTTGAQFIESGRHQRVLVIGADKMSAIVNYEDRATCVIFGDGAGAVILEPGPDDTGGIVDFKLRIDGAGKESLYMKAGGSLRPASHETVDQKMHYLYQDGKTVFKHAVIGMADITRRLLEQRQMAPDDLKMIIPHQANLRIIDAVAGKLGLTPDQVAINIQKYGNTTAATIPIAMSEAYQEGKFDDGDWLLLTAFGAGFSWGSVLLKWALR
jgi:3-oxoacyl-[acyl-carrier-protein] synthase-3